MNEGNYLLAWVVYLLASLGAMILFWRIIRFIPVQAIKNILQLLFSTFIIVPWYIHSGSDYMAPAYVISVFEVFIRKQEVGMATYVLGGLLLLVFIGSTGISIKDFVHGKKTKSIPGRSIDKEAES